MGRSAWENVRAWIASLFYKFRMEEKGGQFMEIALYIALVVIAAAGTLALLGPKIAGKFTEIMNRL